MDHTDGLGGSARCLGRRLTLQPELLELGHQLLPPTLQRPGPFLGGLGGPGCLVEHLITLGSRIDQHPLRFQAGGAQLALGIACGGGQLLVGVALRFADDGQRIAIGLLAKPYNLASHLVEHLGGGVPGALPQLIGIGLSGLVGVEGRLIRPGRDVLGVTGGLIGHLLGGDAGRLQQLVDRSRGAVDLALEFLVLEGAELLAGGQVLATQPADLVGQIFEIRTHLAGVVAAQGVAERARCDILRDQF